MGWITGIMVAMAAQASLAPTAGMDAGVPSCPTTPAPLPAELAGWTRMMPVTAAGIAPHAPLLTLGVGSNATLLPTPKIVYPLLPEKPGDAASSGGLFAFAVPAAARYRVALGAGAWVDVVRDGAAVASVAHGHGPDCSGVRKIVDFDLRPGPYLLQVSGSGMPTLPLMVVRLP